MNDLCAPYNDLLSHKVPGHPQMASIDLSAPGQRLQQSQRYVHHPEQSADIRPPNPKQIQTSGGYTGRFVNGHQSVQGTKPAVWNSTLSPQVHDLMFTPVHASCVLTRIPHNRGEVLPQQSA